MLFRDGIRAPVAALMSDAWIVTHAIKADFKIRAAPMAGVTAARLA